ncbi:uncharacterized protein LOC121234805 isoform X1 [Juglans microcarpa x Juglans regia]|uniref:uncharacterized protein LOC121234805 isoform X1 n=1 Tax=Juglans microcarpa x Juglans regia TaxID=2249226 RepID=UPI001B7E2909|nr:uncharacterized protein LOC121234805 isoform X1 [Juglans microcarpa x Juglans regia]XP_040986843.1 uncharacterized protein LOC121234805 isoform X1 [Juglans microcarpa x Juglans regia]
MGQSGSNLVADSNNTGRGSGFQSSPIPNPELDRAPSNPDRPADERTLVIEENLQHLDFKEVSEPVLKQEDGKAGNWDLKEADKVLEGEKVNGPSNWEGSACRHKHTRSKASGTAVLEPNSLDLPMRPVVEEKVKEPGESTERPGQTECKSYLTSGVCKYGRACRYKHTRSKTSRTAVLEPNSLDLPMRPTIVFGRFNPVVLKVVEEKVKELGESTERLGQAECKAVLEKVKEKEESMVLPGQTECKDSKCRGRMGLSGLKLIADSNNTGWESGFQSPPIPSHELDRALSDPDHPADEHTLLIQEKLQHLDFKEVSEPVLKQEKENGPSNWEEEMGGGSECNGWDDNTNLQVPWIVTDDNWNENETVIEERGERNGGAFTESHQYRSLKTGASGFGSNKFNSPLRRKNKAVMMEKVKKKEESMAMPGQTECKVLFTPIMVVKEKVKEPGKSTERAGQTECKVVKEKVKKPGKSTERPGQTECKVVKQKVKGPGKSTERPGQTECKVVEEKVKGPGESTERPGQTECKSYLTSGVCKYGRACKHKHTKGKASGTAVLELNFLDLPIRPGAKECPFYMSTGSCKYGANCWFNHPDPLAVDQEDDGGSAASVASQSSMSSSSPPRTLNVTTPLVPMELSPLHGIPPQNRYGYQAPVYIPEMSMHPTLAEANVYMYHEDQIQVDEYPERPGQPECSRFIKTGACKFKLNCRYHHPKDRIVKSPPWALSDTGLPLRPDHNICEQFSRYGICKFGQACMFDHPVHPGSGWE